MAGSAEGYASLDSNLLLVVDQPVQLETLGICAHWRVMPLKLVLFA